MSKPIIGTMVCYHDSGGASRPAIIVAVHNEKTVNLAAFDGGGNRFGVKSVVHGSQDGQWDYMLDRESRVVQSFVALETRVDQLEEQIKKLKPKRPKAKKKKPTVKK